MGAFKEIGKTEINSKKNLVVSKMGDEKFAIAQQLIVQDEEGKDIKIFLKNSIIVDAPGLRRIATILTSIADAEEGITEEDITGPAETEEPKKKVAKKVKKDL